MAAARRATAEQAPGDVPTVAIHASKSANPGADAVKWHVGVSVCPPESLSGPERRPASIVCVVDVSGSMQMEASVKTEEGVDLESTGLDRLDVVKHAIRTVLTTLGPTDTLSIVSFSAEAKVPLPPTLMTEEGKTTATTALGALQPESATNLWAGIKAGYELLAESRRDRPEVDVNPAANVNEVLLVMTDGQPNECSHPDGELAALDHHLKAADPCTRRTTISTFGFGYDLDSALLLAVARRCGGGYTFVPDASFVGTAFVNAVSSCLTLHSSNAKVTLRPAANVTVEKVHGIYPRATHRLDGSVEISLGPTHLGQSRDVVLQLTAPPTHGSDPDALLGCVNVTLENDSVLREDVRAVVSAPLRVERERFRLDLCTAIESDSEDADREGGACPAIDRMIAELKSSAAAADPAVAAMLEDLSGQVKEAFSTEYFGTWGLHYLRSLCRSHLLQQCANFKDPGLQFYGGAMFQTLRDDADEIFCGLPPPERAVDPEVERLRALFGEAVPPPQAAAVDMRCYHNAGNPCFHPDGVVGLSGDRTKRVSELCRGDVLSTGGRVVCVVETRCADGVTDLCQIGTLRVTPWHPIRIGGCWKFPADISDPDVGARCPAVYSLVVDGAVSVVIDEVECIVLGHGIRGDPVATHPFFGTRAVLACLARLSGWAEGHVLLEPDCVVRSPATGLVCELFVNEEGASSIHDQRPVRKCSATHPAEADQSIDPLVSL